MRRIALESAVGGMALSIVGMVLAAGGWLSPIMGAVEATALEGKGSDGSREAMSLCMRFIVVGGGEWTKGELISYNDTLTQSAFELEESILV